VLSPKWPIRRLGALGRSEKILMTYLRLPDTL
jgi:hypothetical protein